MFLWGGGYSKISLRYFCSLLAKTDAKLVSDFIYMCLFIHVFVYLFIYFTKKCLDFSAPRLFSNGIQTGSISHFGGFDYFSEMLSASLT